MTLATFIWLLLFALSLQRFFVSKVCLHERRGVYNRATLFATFFLFTCLRQFLHSQSIVSQANYTLPDHAYRVKKKVARTIWRALG